MTEPVIEVGQRIARTTQYGARYQGTVTSVANHWARTDNGRSFRLDENGRPITGTVEILSAEGLAVGDLIRGPINNYGGDFTARVTRTGSVGYPIVQATVTEVHEQPAGTRSFEVGREGLGFLVSDVVKVQAPEPQGTWSPIARDQIRVGQLVRGTWNDDDDDVAAGVVTQVQGDHGLDLNVRDDLSKGAASNSRPSLQPRNWELWTPARRPFQIGDHVRLSQGRANTVPSVWEGTIHTLDPLTLENWTYLGYEKTSSSPEYLPVYSLNNDRTEIVSGLSPEWNVTFQLIDSPEVPEMSDSPVVRLPEVGDEIERDNYDTGNSVRAQVTEVESFGDQIRVTYTYDDGRRAGSFGIRVTTGDAVVGTWSFVTPEPSAVYVPKVGDTGTRDQDSGPEHIYTDAVIQEVHSEGGVWACFYEGGTFRIIKETGLPTVGTWVLNSRAPETPVLAEMENWGDPITDPAAIRLGTPTQVTWESGIVQVVRVLGLDEDGDVSIAGSTVDNYLSRSRITSGSLEVRQPIVRFHTLAEAKAAVHKFVQERASVTGNGTHCVSGSNSFLSDIGLPAVFGELQVSEQGLIKEWFATVREQVIAHRSSMGLGNADDYLTEFDLEPITTPRQSFVMEFTMPGDTGLTTQEMRERFVRLVREAQVTDLRQA